MEEAESDPGVYERRPRPGRFDRGARIGPHDEQDPEAIFLPHMRGLKLAESTQRDRLAARLTAALPSLIAADLTHVCRRAALTCTKEASTTPDDPAPTPVAGDHFYAVIASQSRAPSENRLFNIANDSALPVRRAMNSRPTATPRDDSSPTLETEGRQ